MTTRKVVLFLMVLIIVDLPATTAALDLEKCKQQLGMEANTIPDDAITASSTHNHKFVGPQHARIRQDELGGAWCPKNYVDKDSYEYLQIDLRQLMVITSVEVQGRFGNGQGLEFTEEFLLEYQRQDGGEWIRFRNKQGEEKFEGNENPYLEVIREVSPPIIGRRIRFIPFSQRQRSVCMRVEMYGCPWTDGILSYAMRQGDTRGSENNFFDFTYDGTRDPDDTFLSRGLGQLTDGEKGDANFRLASEDTNIKGYEWVGWRNDSTAGAAPIELIFMFETPRNFSSVTINSNNYFSKNIRVFNQAKIYFSIGGKFYPNTPVVYDYIRDTAFETSRDVEIDLQYNVGKFVKIMLYYDVKWIMISEVEFDSVPAEGNFSVELSSPTALPSPEPTEGIKHTMNDDQSIPNVDVQSADPGLYQDSGETDTISKTPGEKASANEDYISIIIGALAALIVILTIVVIFIIVRYKRRRNLNRQSLKPVSDTVLNINLNNFQNNMNNGKVSNGNVYNGVATEDEERVKDVNGKGQVYN